MTKWEGSSATARKTVAERFRQTIVDRARKRTVRDSGVRGTWIVDGEPKLSDHLAGYTVTLEPAAGKYLCTCYGNTYGEVRAAKVCSHVVAVLLYREATLSNGSGGSLNGQRADGVPARGSALQGSDGSGHDRGEEVGGTVSPDDDRDTDPDRVPRGADASSAVAGDDSDEPAPVADVDPDDLERWRTGEWLVHPVLRKNPQLEGVPEWMQKWREYQRDAVEACVQEFAAGKKYMWLQMPTGGGKSAIGESVRRFVGGSALYLTRTKQLQEQILSERNGFPYAALLQGKANYATADYPEKFGVRESKYETRITCADCDLSKGGSCDTCKPVLDEGEQADDAWEGSNSEWDEPEPQHLKQRSEAWHCSMCHSIDRCPYGAARTLAHNSQLATLNYAYAINEWQGRGIFASRSLVIADEADELEDTLMGHVEFTLSPRMQQQLGIEPPAKKTVQESWEEWLQEECLPKLMAEKGRRKSLLTARPRDIKLRRQVKSINDLIQKAKWVGEELPEGGWIYDYAASEERGNSRITFKPIRVSHFGESLLGAHGQRFLFMSATIISPETMMDDLGLEDPTSTPGWHDTPSIFPVENRPINVYPAANMTNAQKGTEWPKMAAAVKWVIDNQHPNDRVLVHTVSGELARYLHETMRSPRTITYKGGQDRVSALERYKRTPGAVLLAQSFERGVSLDDELCRAMIVAKVPFPYLGDKQVSARLHEPGNRLAGQSWYTVQTIRSLVQSTGRGVRSATDHAVAWVLDAQFNKLFRQNERLFPRWWREALMWQGSWRRDLERRMGEVTAHS